MVRDTGLREVIRPDLLRAVSGSDLRSAQIRLLVMTVLHLQIVQLGTKQCPGLVLILKLRTLRLGINDNSCRKMRQTHRRVRRVDALSAVSGCSCDIHPDVLRRNVNLDVIRHLRHDRNGNRRGMNSSLRLRRRNALHPVYTALIFHPGIGSLSDDHEVHELHAADAALFKIQELRLPAAALRVVHVHPVNLRRKKCCFISARACTDFTDDVLVVIRILRKKEHLHLFRQLLHALLGIGKLIPCHFLHFRVALRIDHLK